MNFISRNVSAILKQKQPPTAAIHVIPHPSHQTNKKSKRLLQHPYRKMFLYPTSPQPHHLRGLFAPNQTKNRTILPLSKEEKTLKSSTLKDPIFKSCRISSYLLKIKSKYTKHTHANKQPYTECYQFTPHNRKQTNKNRYLTKE